MMDDDIKLRFEIVDTRIDSIHKELLETSKYQRENTKNLGMLIEESRDLIKTYKDVQGTLAVGKGVQKLLAWVAKWPLILAGLYSIIQYFSTKG